MHFRIWADTYESLDEEARRKNVSLNTLLNQVVSTHSSVDLQLEEMGYIKLPKDGFRVLLSLLSDDGLKELGGEIVKKVPITMMMARSGTVTANAVLDRLRFGSRLGLFSVHETETRGKKAISLAHDFGPGFSVFLGSYATSLFALVGISPKITTANSLIMIEY